MYDLKGRGLLVTGGGRGLGAAIARDFAMEGCNLAITYLEDGQAARETSEKLQKMCGVNVLVIQGVQCSPQEKPTTRLPGPRVVRS